MCANPFPTPTPFPAHVTHTSCTFFIPQGIIAAVLGLGTLNRVLYRLALVPLRDYVFFLAQAQNIGYIVIYYFLLWIRYRWDLKPGLPSNGPPVRVGVPQWLRQFVSCIRHPFQAGCAVGFAAVSSLLWLQQHS